jgi:hypothetical protein
MDHDESSQPSPPRSHLAPATSFKPLGSSRAEALESSYEDSTDQIEVPEDDYEDSFNHQEDSGIAISSSFEPESPEPKSSSYAPNASQLKSSSSLPSHSTVEVKSTSSPNNHAAEKMVEEENGPSRATVRSFTGGSIVHAAARSNQDDEYDFDDSAHEVSLKPASSNNQALAEDDEGDEEDSEDEAQLPRFSPSSQSNRVAESKALDAWSKPTSSATTSKPTSSNNQEDDEEEDEYHDPADSDEDFDDYDVDGALAPSKSSAPSTSSAKPTTSLFKKTGSHLEDDDDEEDSYKDSPPKKTINASVSQTKSSSHAEDDYGDDFDEVEEVEEDDDMSVGKDESDDDDDAFGGSSYRPNTYSSATTKPVANSKPSSAVAQERISAIEERMNQLEQENSTGKISQIKSSQKIYDDQGSDEISVASENVDEMDFSVGDNNNDADSSTDSNLYSFLDNPGSKSNPRPKPLLSERKSDSKKASLSNSGDFSVSEHEIDAFASDSSYDFTTNAQPPDRKR